MNQMNIPTIGTVLILGKDWTFQVTAEYRNSALLKFLEATGVIPKDAPRYEPLPPLCEHPVEVTYFSGMARTYPCQGLAGHLGEHTPHMHYPRDYVRYACTFPRGTRLRVDRIYIRKGASAYDSLTFWAVDLGEAAKGKKKSVRFWAKLADVNQMIVTDKPISSRPAKIKAEPIRVIVLRDEPIPVGSV